MHEVGAGGGHDGRILGGNDGADAGGGKATLAGLQRHLVQAQAEDHCRSRRRCQRCGAQRPLKDRPPPAVGVVVRHGGGSRAALRPCRCARDLAPDAQPGCGDHARPMHAGVRAHRRKDGRVAALPPGPRRCWRSFSRSATPRRWRRSGSEPCMSAPGWSERRWRRQRSAPPTEAESIALSIDGGHVRAARSYQVRSVRGLRRSGQQRRRQAGRIQQRAGRGRSADASSCAACCMALGRRRDAGHHPERRRRWAAIAWARRRALVRPTMCWTGFISRCASSTSLRRPRAGRTPRRTSARKALASPTRSSRSAGVSGMARSAGSRSHRRNPGDRSKPRPRRRRRSPRPRARWRGCLRDLETYVSGQSDMIIDYATARRREEPISTATTESTVQWLLHRRMERQAADALVAARRASDAQGPNLGRERHARPGSCRRRAMGPPSVSESGVITPRFWTVS